MPVTTPMQPVDVSDPPFLPPLDVVIDLPFPPSVNRIWRAQRNPIGRQVRLSDEYQSWKRQADALALSRRACRASNKVAGPFEAEIKLNVEAGLGDLDNRAKAVLDWLHSREITSDDKFCRRLTLEWVIPEAAPDGCRVILRPMA